jgi:6-phosphofructokinase 2
MAKVVTLTPNPAIDIAVHVPQLVPSHKLRCDDVRRDPGGGGINVARVVHRLGGETLAIYPAGGGPGNELQSLLDLEGLQHRPVRVAGRTRESFNVTEDCTREQYRFVLPGEPMSTGECNSCIVAAHSFLNDSDFLVGSGSLPPGTTMDLYARLFSGAKSKGAKTVIDSQGESLRLALASGVSILKASARELSEYLQFAPSSLRQWRDTITNLVKTGRAETVVVTLGEQGAILGDGNSSWHAAVPTVLPLTTVGAGDSFLGGLLVKFLQGDAFDVALRHAAAAGTAALLTSGTGLCDPADVAKLSERVEITSL